MGVGGEKPLQSLRDTSAHAPMSGEAGEGVLPQTHKGPRAPLRFGGDDKVGDKSPRSSQFRQRNPRIFVVTVPHVSASLFAEGRSFA